MGTITVADIIALIGVATSLYFALRKAPLERRKMKVDTDVAQKSEYREDATAAASYAAAAKTYADEVLHLRTQIMDLEKQVNDVDDLRDTIMDLRRSCDTLQAKYDLCVAEQVRLQTELTKWKDWARKLADQVISLGGTPVPLEPGVSPPT